MRNDYTPRQLGEAIGVSESSVKRWVDDGTIVASRTAGGHRRIPLREAVRFIRESGMPVVRPESLGLVDLLSYRRATGPGANAALSEALAEGRGDVARGIVVSRYLAGVPPSEICDGAIAPAMHEIGERWKADPAAMVVEHRATDLCVQALSLVRCVVPHPRAGEPSAVGCAPPGDPYLLPSLMAAFVLEADGWRASNLGPDLPLDRLADAAEEERASLVWISVSSESARSGLSARLRGLVERLASSGAQTILGGRALPDMAADLAGGSIRIGRSMSDLAAFARDLRDAPGPSAVRREA